MWIKMKAKYKGYCRRCRQSFEPGTEIEYENEKHTTRHPECETYKVNTLSGQRVKLRIGRR